MSTVADNTDKASIAQRLKKELFKYGLVSGYLFICFSILLVYKTSITVGAQGELHFSLALVKALVLGKFLLIGEALKAGSRMDAQTLVHRVAWKSLAFLLVLLVLTAVEELIVGWYHDKTVIQITDELLGRGWLENLAPVLLMLLILIPLVSISEIFRQLGPETFKRLWLEAPS